jgi:hypothetical protein
MKNLKTIALALTVVFSTLSNGANKSRCFKVVSIGLERKYTHMEL